MHRLSLLALAELKGLNFKQHATVINGMENKHKHLEFIQAVIARLFRHSFVIKGWSLTLVTVILALTTAREEYSQLVGYSFLPLIYFWWLDGYYNLKERRYHDLYDDVRRRNEMDVNFSMDAVIRARVIYDGSIIFLWE